MVACARKRWTVNAKISAGNTTCRLSLTKRRRTVSLLGGGAAKRCSGSALIGYFSKGLGFCIGNFRRTPRDCFKYSHLRRFGKNGSTEIGFYFLTRLVCQACL